MRPFDLARPAQRDFLQAIEFLETRNSEAALRWERRLVSELFDIAAAPLLSPVREEFASAPRRVRVFGNDLIIYDPSRDPIVILRIVHASRDLFQ